MRLKGTNERFERLVMAHMDAAYNLAYWITRDPHEAEEAVQEALLRAYRFFDSFHGENGKAWLLGIVRNTCYTLYSRNRPSREQEAFDEEQHTPNGPAGELTLSDPEAAAIRHAERDLVSRAIEALPVEYREALVLRELEGMSYKEIAQLLGIPMGTVMSRLARGRSLIQRALAAHFRQEDRG
ncbi:sigma-70 family RNA polymerase sigma factor [Pelomicrobium sp.]|uniref:sigma-70 family RNA polymerase sigma factor n=1 Tax=Pelomicrobium sp. TaxID=2815319 RepID=UPI002FDD023E